MSSLVSLFIYVISFKVIPCPSFSASFLLLFPINAAAYAAVLVDAL
jgi:hypothetical protein